jgi:hypothetical protein
MPDGLYGFAVSGLDGPGELLHAPQEDWPELFVSHTRSAPDRPPVDGGPGTVRIGHETAEVWITPTESMELDRAATTLRFVTHADIAAELVVHPFLALPAAIAARWLGRQSVHGGAFAHAGGAWAVLGDKESGKSSVLGWLLREGFEILSDDMLIVADGVMFSGPRCIDLRPSAAALLGGEEVLAPGQSRPRWRLRAGGVPASAPLAGVIHLAWGDSVRIEPLGAAERLEQLVRNSIMYPGPEEALPYLELAALPSLRFTRPRDLDQFEQANAQLVSSLP